MMQRPPAEPSNHKILDRRLSASLCFLCGLAIFLVGCRRANAPIAQFAENIRNSTEQMAVISARENEQRERNSVTDIANIRTAPAVSLVERYETRQGPDGLFVYDREQHATARLDSQPQAGLNPEQAAQAVDALVAADNRGDQH